MTIKILTNFDDLAPVSPLSNYGVTSFKHSTPEGVNILHPLYAGETVIRNEIAKLSSPKSPIERNWMVSRGLGVSSAHASGIYTPGPSFLTNANIPVGSKMVLGVRVYLKTAFASPKPIRSSLATQTPFTPNNSNLLSTVVFPPNTDSYVEFEHIKLSSTSMTTNIYVNDVLAASGTSAAIFGVGHYYSDSIQVSTGTDFIAYNDIYLSLDYPDDPNPTGRLGPIITRDFGMSVIDSNNWKPLIEGNDLQTVINSQLTMTAGNYDLTDSVMSEPNGKPITLKSNPIEEGVIVGASANCVANTSRNYFGDLNAKVFSQDQLVVDSGIITMPYTPAASTVQLWRATAKPDGGPLDKAFLDDLEIVCSSVSRF